MLKIFTNFGGIPSVSVVALDAATVTDIALMDFAAVAVCVVARGHVAGDDDAMSAFKDPQLCLPVKHNRSINYKNYFSDLEGGECIDVHQQ